MSVLPAPSGSEKNLPIRYVAQATGVLPVTLRAWERRYGLLRPARTGKGHRLYSEEDIATIRQIVALLQRGLPIGRARNMLDQPGPQTAQTSDWPALRKRLAAAAQSLDAQATMQIIRKAGELYPLIMLAESLVLRVDRLLAQAQGSTAWAARRVLMDACELYLLQRSQHGQPVAGSGSVIVAGLGESRLFPAARLFVACMREAGVDARWLGPMPDVAAFAETLRQSGAVGGIVWEDGEPDGDWEAMLRHLVRLRPCLLMLGGELARRHAASLAHLAIPTLPADTGEAASILLGLRRNKPGRDSSS